MKNEYIIYRKKGSKHKMSPTLANGYERVNLLTPQTIDPVLYTIE